MADLLSLFGNEDELLSTFNEPVKNSSKVVRPNILYKSITELNFLNNDKLKLTNGIRHLNTPIEEHKCFIMQKIRSLSCTLLPSQLPPENPKGNIEYKRQLINLTTTRLNHLTTQLKWRLREGGGEAIYEIGVDDNGEIIGLEISQLVESICYLCRMAESLNAEVTVQREREIGNKKAFELFIKSLPPKCSTNEIRVALLGNTDSGKSTLIGVLTQGIYDNGHGKTREATFRHKHEVQTGRTSCVNSQILGFKLDGSISNFYYQRNLLHQVSLEQIVATSNKLISLIDSGGSQKYQRTALFTLTAKRPHLVLFIIPATHGLMDITKTQFDWCKTLKLPFIIIINKIDLISPESTLKQIKNWLKQSTNHNQKYKIQLINNEIMAKSLAKKILIQNNNNEVDNSDCNKINIIPTFCISCVTGVDIDLLTKFLSFLNNENENDYNEYDKDKLNKDDKDGKENSEIWIDQIMHNVLSINGASVVGGLVHLGNVSKHDQLFLGPQKDGSFLPVIVQSIHRNRLPQTKVCQGQYASFAISVSNNSKLKENCLIQLTSYTLIKGMVLVRNIPNQCLSLNYGIGIVSSNNQSKLKPRLAWGLVINKLTFKGCQCSLHSQKSISVRLKRQSCPDFQLTSLAQCLLVPNQYWVLHCGNVNSKVKLVQQTILCNSMNNSNEEIEDRQNILVFEFTNQPQWINPNYQVVFHQRIPGSKTVNSIVNGTGKIVAVLGSRRFEKRSLKGNKKRKRDFIIGSDDDDDDDAGGCAFEDRNKCNGCNNRRQSSGSDNSDAYLTASSSLD